MAPTKSPDAVDDLDVDIDEIDDFASDPALAAALGFSSFGAQGRGRKRKHNPDSAVVDVAPQSQGHGANAAPVGLRRECRVAVPATCDDGAHAGDVVILSGGAKASLTHIGALDDAAVAGEEGRGARVEQGYFMPSFVEDPWRELYEKRARGRT